MNLRLSLASALIAGLASTSANAVTDTTTVNINGTLTRPPCTLSSAKTLNVNFGTIRADLVDDAPKVDIPVTMNCPANSALSISVKASNHYAGQTTIAYAEKASLGYQLYWKSDNTAIDITGAKRNLTNQSGNVDLSMNAKLVSYGKVTEGAFSASAVISIEYL